MKTKALLFTFLACGSLSFAQVQIDSSFTVKDTLTVEDDARVGHNLEVDGTTDINNLNVYGTTTLKYLQSPLQSDTFGVLVTTPNGTVMRSGVGDLFPVPKEPLGFCDLAGNGYSTSPYWVSQPNVLYTACPDVFVGIGTGSPRVNLDVRGTTHSDYLAISTDPLNMLGAKLKIGGYLPTMNTELVNISNSSNEIFRLNNQGLLNLNGQLDLEGQLDVNGGIALVSDETSPFVISNSSEKILQLNSDGLLRSRAIQVDVYQWPDYVFEEDYELRSLEEIKAYIENNGHLPDVPSAEVVEAQGMDVAEMNKILLQKVEELTLLLIEQDEKMKELEQIIKEE
mmetsp:Transcript_38940/g.50960  ORF Transcript_38940/g.50960 Transcript_38940/m.50960 type:complete len:340 (+) Transcript_38940:269-1288(+)|eukprot:CAMPEP_0185593652 /NCGR_PEP_ID=MMETSP0434-20130131/72142_1 /TAXON_ID=626734 ORGANISM="Favella taraikaensis, Strain Fe Narragansett Bay" /NCGR_SAMPLE_ID=MMETSP0434 /ASSEMBLY_ACC=CAM_ASM_000379 /LENGTH=339 /DNA_ID=CAMNT_0028220385 /DNA_START=247 /DNA_END=1266 /DNA_ORIENTATION=-